jgi:hypothetical protein
MNLKWNRNHTRFQRPSFALALGALAALFCLNTYAHATNVVDGGFEAAGTAATYFTGQYIDPTNSWYVNTGAVYIDSNDPWVYAGNNSLNLTYDNLYAPNTVSQTISTTPGQSYLLSFWADADASNTFSVKENGLTIGGMPTSIVDNGFPNNTNSNLFVDYSAWFIANSTTTTLAFTSTADPAFNSGDGSVMIDNVNVQAPEPSSIVLMFSGILGLAFFAGSKRLTASDSAL